MEQKTQQDIVLEKLIREGEVSNKYNIKEDGFRPVYKGIPPFTKFEKGFGYYGVLLEDEESGKLQCHLCGELNNNLAKHIFHKHKDFTAKKYKEIVGLNLTTPLMSESTRKKFKNNFLDLTEEKQQETIERLRSNNRKVHREKLLTPRSTKGTLEHKNKYGTCPEQAKTLFWEEYNKIGHIPIDKEMSNKLRNIIYTRFTSYREALLAWGITEQQYREHVVEGQIKVHQTRAENDFFPKYDKEKVKQQYADFFFKNKRLPTWGEVKQYGLPKRSVFERVFGTCKSDIQNSFKVNEIED